MEAPAGAARRQGHAQGVRQGSARAHHQPIQRLSSIRSQLRAHAAVLAAGVLFGSTFVVMKDAVDRVAPVPFIAARFLIGALALAPFVLPGRPRRSERGSARAALWCATALLAGYICQTVGLQYTAAS